MRKMKALLLSIALGFTFVAAATAVSCNKKEEAASSSSSNWFDDETESLVSLRFASGQVDVNQYENVDLNCTVKGTLSKVTFSSSDESIVTVDENGIASAKGKMGSATITATVDGITATCTVNVKKSPYAPQIVFDTTEYTIEEGETLQFSVATEWNRTELDEDIEYAVSFAENSQDAAANISVEGNTVKVVGASVENIDVIVSATVRGVYTSKMFSVNVVAATLKLKPVELAFQPSVSGYHADISTTALIGDMVNSLPLNFAVMKGNQTFEDAVIDWTINGNAAVLEDGYVVGQKRGTVNIKGTTTYEGETATIEIICDVLPPEVYLDETAVLELENLSTVRIQSEILGALQNAELHGVTVSSRVSGSTILFNKDTFPKTADKLGAQELVINTELVRYIMPVNVYTMIINDADELDTMLKIANTGETEWSIRFEKEVNSQYYDGYYVLGNDINYNKTITAMTDTGTVWGVQGTANDLTRGFKGVFDGLGYNIDGVTVGRNPCGDVKQSGGIFGYLAANGVVRNVSFTNATLLTNQGFICSAGNGTIENVSVSYKKLGGDKATEGLNSSTPRQMGTFFTLYVGVNATVRNCLIDATAADIVLENGVYSGEETYNLKLAGNAATIENVVVLCPDDYVLSRSGGDVKKRTFVEVAEEPKLFANFDTSIWTLIENIPMFVKQAENLDRNATMEFLNVEPSLIAGFEMVVRTNNPYTKIELVETEGVSFDGAVLTATEEAFTKTVTLKATSLLNPEITATCQVYIDSFGKEVATPVTDETPVLYNTNPVLTIGDNSWLGEENYVYLGSKIIGSGSTQINVDFQALNWGINDVTVVSVKDGVREHFNVELELDYTKSALADSEIVKDTAFSTWKGDTSVGPFVDVASDIAAPEGYEKVSRLDSYADWPSALPSGCFVNVDVSEYKDIWFAVKSVNITRYIFQTVEVVSSEWVYFHYTQTSEGIWAAEVTVNGNVYKIEYNIVGTLFNQLFYRDGWSNGFLIYNNNRGDGAVTDERPTSIYMTEIRGVK